MTQDTPFSRSTSGACSREEPQPKLRVATTMSPGCILWTNSASISSIAWVASSLGSAMFR